MDRRIYDAIITALALAARLYAYYMYKKHACIFFWMNEPVENEGLKGMLVKIRNFIYRNTLQDRLWNYIEARSVEGNTDSVLAAFDDYSYNYEWTWAIGDKKAAILAKVVQEAKPKVVLECGTFLGYSACIIAQNMHPDGKIITVEANPKSADVARKIIDRAGFGDKVTIINGFSYDVIAKLHRDYYIKTIDMVFLDHFSQYYVSDLQQLEKGGYLHNGTVVFADNIKGNGSKGFSQYIHGLGHYDCQFYKADVEYTEGTPDGMERGIFKGVDVFTGETLGL